MQPMKSIVDDALADVLARHPHSAFLQEWQQQRQAEQADSSAEQQDLAAQVSAILPGFHAGMLDTPEHIEAAQAVLTIASLIRQADARPQPPPIEQPASPLKAMVTRARAKQREKIS